MTRNSVMACAPHLALGAALLSAAAASFGADGILAYTAAYEVEYKGRSVGASELAVAYDPHDSVYTFSSHTSAKGLLRLANPNPTIERSSFTVAADGALRPLEFRFQDGSRSGEDHLHLLFDWDRNIAQVTDAQGTREIAVAPGVLDRASLQVQLIRDLARQQEPGRYALADGDGVKGYEYTANGTAQLRTGVGAMDTVIYIQRRDGSSRETWLWLAPKLHYLPVRIEQRREGETRTALLLKSVSGLTNH